MYSILLKRLSNLLCVKSIVTLILTSVFAYLAAAGQVSSHDFLTVFSVVIAFYFGTQSQKVQDVLTDGTEDSPTTITNYYQLPTEEGENVDSK